MLVYSITNKQSFEAIEGWITEVQKYTTAGVKCFLIGNKSDMEQQREVQYDEGLVYNYYIKIQELAKKLNINFLETSAKNSNNVGTAFSKIAEAIDEEIMRSKANSDTANNLGTQPLRNGERKKLDTEGQEVVKLTVSKQTNPKKKKKR